MISQKPSSQPAQVVGVDEFLSGELNSPAADRLVASFQFAKLTSAEAQDAVVVVSADDVSGRFSLTPDSMSMLRAEIQAWLKALRDKGIMVTELLSVTSRDQSVRQIIQSLLDVAYKSASRSWMTGLPTGKQIVIVPTPVVEMVGFEGVCRVAHERAIRTAQNHGRPFNAQAWEHYQRLKPMEMT